MTCSPKASLRPPTPVIGIGKVLNSSSPRETDWRYCDPALAHALYNVNTSGLNVLPEGSPASESLMPTKKFWFERLIGPPVAPLAAVKRERSQLRAVGNCATLAA